MTTRHRRIALLTGASLTAIAAAGVPCNTEPVGTPLTVEKLRAGARAVERISTSLPGSIDAGDDWPLEEVPW